MNWYLINKTGDLSYLLEDRTKSVDEKTLFDIYDKLLLSDGGIEFRLQYLYFKAMSACFEYHFTPSHILENKYNVALDKYLLLLGKEVNEDIPDLWNKYFKEVGYEHSLRYGALEFDYHKFEFKKNKSDLFKDIAKLSRGLGYQINPYTTSVNAYKSIVSDFNSIKKPKK